MSAGKPYWPAILKKHEIGPGRAVSLVLRGHTGSSSESGTVRDMTDDYLVIEVAGAAPSLVITAFDEIAQVQSKA